MITTITVSERPMNLAPRALTTVSRTTTATAKDLSNSGDGVVVTKVAA